LISFGGTIVAPSEEDVAETSAALLSVRGTDRFEEEAPTTDFSGTGVTFGTASPRSVALDALVVEGFASVSGANFAGPGSAALGEAVLGPPAGGGAASSRGAAESPSSVILAESECVSAVFVGAVLTTGAGRATTLEEAAGATFAKRLFGRGKPGIKFWYQAAPAAARINAARSKYLGIAPERLLGATLCLDFEVRLDVTRA
jgi:hypothetical protein